MGVLNELNCIYETLWSWESHKTANNITTKTNLIFVFIHLNRKLSEHNAVSVSFLNIGKKIYACNLRCCRILLTQRILEDFSRDSRSRGKPDF